MDHDDTSRARRLFREFLPVLVAASVALVARSSFADHYVVPSGSMLPTVELEDHVVVNKLAYGVHLPLLPGYLARFSNPVRGDVVVLTAPDTGITLLKRVVALPGDRVEVTAGEAGARFLLVAGKPLGEPVVQYGPFVMNSEAEIRQAIVDFQSGRF